MTTNVPETTANNVDGKTFSIGVLSITACVLFAALLLVPASQQPAYAEGQTTRSGDFHMTTFRVADSRESIAVTDVAARKMLLYAWDGGDRELVLQAGYDLSRTDRADRENNRRRRR